jgi:2-keto-myo-inositol isomerase
MVGQTFISPQTSIAQSSETDVGPIRYCLNTSTIRGHKRSLVEEVDLVAAAGYDGIEPWIGEIQAHLESGRSLPDLRQRLIDHNLKVESAIGFAPWIVDDETQRAAGLEVLKRDMDLVRQIGGSRIAAPPAGATDQADLDLDRAAERYAAALELGRSMGVTPQLEVWGFSQSLRRLSEVIYVAVAAAHDDACLLPDVYHLFKGGSDFRSLSLIGGSAIHVMHLNDYPGTVPRETMQDKDRVYPGEGIAPLDQIIRQLRANGFQGVFSLELFNPDYWQRPVEEILTVGLAKMQAAVAASSAT